MSSVMEYKNYLGSVEFSEADRLFYGKVQGVNALISYEGKTAEELLGDFHEAVDDYLSLCRAEGKEPESAYAGSFNVHISPELHRQAAACALSKSISLNSLVETALRESVAY